MKHRLLALLACLSLGAALPAGGQDGLRLSARDAGTGIDPSLAGGWLSPERDRLSFGPGNWRDSYGFAPSQRMQWSYPLGGNGSLGMSMASGRDFDAAPIYGVESRQYGLVGRYSFAQDWSLSAETSSREAGTLFRLQDFRIGLHRQF